MKTDADHCLEVFWKFQSLISETESRKSSSAAECVESKKNTEAGDKAESEIFIENTVLIHKGKGARNASASQANIGVFICRETENNMLYLIEV